VILIANFCDRHRACQDGRKWALDNCVDMHDAWQRLEPDWLLWVATRPGVLTDRELRLFAVFCARQVEHLLTDQRSKDAIDTAEKFAKGEATYEELAAAEDAAWAAARVAAWDAAWAAAEAAARVAAWGSDRDAAWAAARVAAWDAAWDAAWAAARVAAWGSAASAARVAAWGSAASAARVAAWGSAWDAAWGSAWDAAWAAQSDWLRANTQPNFGVEVTQ